MRVDKAKKCNIKNHKYKFEQYEILNSTYDQRMAAIQTVIIINITLSSAILIILCSDLNIIDLILSNNLDNFHSLGAACILSLIGFIESSLCLVSTISQSHSCKILRKKLYDFEIKFSLYTLHSKNQLKLPIILTICGTIITTVTFLFFSLLSIIKLC